MTNDPRNERFQSLRGMHADGKNVRKNTLCTNRKRYIDVLYVAQRWPQRAILQLYVNFRWDDETKSGMVHSGDNNRPVVHQVS